MEANISSTVSTINSSVHNSWYETAALGLWIYLSPVLIVVGLCGNIISGIVFQRKTLRGTCTSVCLVVLSAMDSTLLIFGLGRQWIKYAFDRDLRSLSQGTCTFHLSLIYFAFQFEPWILVTISMERFISVVLPFRAKGWCTWRNALIALSCEFVIFVSINLHFYWTYEVQSDGSCTNKEETARFADHIWPWLDFCLALFLPFVLMLIFNTIVCVKLCRLEKRQRRHSTSSNTIHTSKTAMLLTVTFTFLLLQAPLAVYLGIANGNVNDIETEDDMERTRHQFIWSSVNLLAYTNCCANFFLYCMSSAVFRHDIRQLFCAFKSHKDYRSYGSKDLKGSINSTPNNTSISAINMPNMSCIST